MAFVYAEPALAREHILRAGGAPVRRGRRAALVASAERARRAHPVLRRPGLAAVRGGPLRAGHRRRARCSTSTCRSSPCGRSSPDEHEVYDLPQVADEHGERVRALPARAAAGLHHRRARPAADRHRRLERRHEPGRGGGPGRERVAGLVPGRPRCGRSPRTRRRGATTAVAARAAGAGRRATPRRSRRTGGTARGTAARTSTTARRSARAQNDECRIDSIAQSWSVISGAGDPERQAQAMRSLEEHLVREDARLLMLLTPPFDKTPKDPGLHQGLSARRAGERRAVHPRRALGGAGHRAAGRRRPRLRAVPDDQPAHPRAHAARRSRPTRSSPTSSRPTSTPPRASSAAAAGPGTPARRAGCTGSGWRRSSASPSGATRSCIEPCVPAAWPGFTIEYRYGKARYIIQVDNTGAVGSRTEISLDGQTVGGAGIQLVDDGREHAVVVRLARAHGD